MAETKQNAPIAWRIMAAWMRLNGHSEDEIADTRPEPIEVEIANLEAAVRMQEKQAGQWPKYYVHRDESERWYVRRDNPRTRVIVYAGQAGSITEWDSQEDRYVSRGWWIEVTEAEAKARLTPSLSTCPDCGEFRGHGHEDVCPMAWATQDRADVRPEIDQVYRSRTARQWLTATGANWRGFRHGHDYDGDILHVRCRRKDLPKPIYCPDCNAMVGEGHEDVCPMAWVTQDRVPDRAGVDQWKWSGMTDWCNSIRALGTRKHGEMEGGQTLEVRCRRKDLPPVPDTIGNCPLCGAVRGREYEHVCESKPDPASPFGDAMSQPVNRVPVRLYWYDGNIVGRYAHCVPTDESYTEVKNDVNGFYVER